MSRKSTEFSKRVVDGGARIILIGMSNVGKSHRAQDLEQNAGFTSKDVDAVIESKLREVMIADGISDMGIQAVASWMGSPHAARLEDRKKFEQAQRKYLDLEAGVYSSIGPVSKENLNNSVIDTTGSFVHCSKKVQNALARTGVVVYLSAEEQDYEDMLASYLEQPKPVVWGDAYTEEEGEASEESIVRSYGNLLQLRHNGYAEVADVTMPKSEAWNLGAGDFLRSVAERLEE